MKRGRGYNRCQKGTSEKEYSPQTNITRADFLYFLVRTLGVDATFDGNFDDISSDAYYYKEIGIAKMLGITSGIGNNTFNPDAGITRQDMIVLTERALKLLKGFSYATIMKDRTLDMFPYTDHVEVIILLQRIKR